MLEPAAHLLSTCMAPACLTLLLLLKLQDKAPLLVLAGGCGLPVSCCVASAQCLRCAVLCCLLLLFDWFAGQGTAAGAGRGPRAACVILGAAGADGWGGTPGHLL